MKNTQIKLDKAIDIISNILKVKMSVPLVVRKEAIQSFFETHDFTHCTSGGGNTIFFQPGNHNFDVLMQTWILDKLEFLYKKSPLHKDNGVPIRLIEPHVLEILFSDEVVSFDQIEHILPVTPFVFKKIKEKFKDIETFRVFIENALEQGVEKRVDYDSGIKRILKELSDQFSEIGTLGWISVPSPLMAS